MEKEPVPAQLEKFPSTRYLGSKRKLLPFLYDVFADLEFDTVLDPFCGTGAVSYLLKCMGKTVTASDTMAFNVVCARALVENSASRLGDLSRSLCKGLPRKNSPAGFVEQNFEDLFFETDENRIIDQLKIRIDKLESYERDLARFALFQSCLAKRPYNLFHRANLYMRQNDVKRSFGNKSTWDTPFSKLITRYGLEADKAVFATDKKINVFQECIENVDLTNHSLVYLDPPYMPETGQGVDYIDYYHFLEGLCLESDDWEKRLLTRYKHRPIEGRGTSPFSNRKAIEGAFEQLVGRTRGTLVVSYRSDGVPGVEQIVSFMKKHGKTVIIRDVGKYTYALSKNKKSREIVLIGT